jgi:hypothetical protein
MRQADGPHNEMGIMDRLEEMALRTQMVDALERAIKAAATHADECVHINTRLFRAVAMLSHFLNWIKLQQTIVSKTSTVGLPAHVVARRCHFIEREIAEFERRLGLLLKSAETFVGLVGGCGGTFSRHQRLAKVVRMVRAARPDGSLLCTEVEERCESILDSWRRMARKLDAIVYSLHLRSESFIEVLESLCQPGHCEAASSMLRCAGPKPWRQTGDAEQPSVAKLSVLTAIAASMVTSSAASSASTCNEAAKH